MGFLEFREFRVDPLGRMKKPPQLLDPKTG